MTNWWMEFTSLSKYIKMGDNYQLLSKLDYYSFYCNQPLNLFDKIIWMLYYVLYCTEYIHSHNKSQVNNFQTCSDLL